MGDTYCAKAMQSSMFKALKFGKKCLTHYDLAVTRYPKSTQALLSASLVYLQAPSMIGGSKDKGMHYLEQLMDVSSEHAITLKVALLQEKGKSDEAVALASDLAEREFTSEKNQYEIARFFQLKNNYQKAIKLYKPLTRMTPTLDNVWHINDSALQLGQIYIV